MAEWIVVNGHVVGQCAYLRSLDNPWELESPCDCADLLEDDPVWDAGWDYEAAYEEFLRRAEVPDAAL